MEDAAAGADVREAVAQRRRRPDRRAEHRGPARRGSLRELGDRDLGGEGVGPPQRHRDLQVAVGAVELPALERERQPRAVDRDVRAIDLHLARELEAVEVDRGVVEERGELAARAGLELDAVDGAIGRVADLTEPAAFDRIRG